MENNKEQELGELIFDLMTENFKDKVDLTKDLYDYLKEETKDNLLAIYLLYEYAANREDIEEIDELKRKKKEEIIKRIMELLDKEISSIFGFFNRERMDYVKNMASYNELIYVGNNTSIDFNFEIVLVLKKINFIFCKREKNGNIIIHMPNFIKEKIKNINKDPLYDYYDKVVCYSKGIAETYGAIHVDEAFDLIKDDIPIDFERYDTFIKFISILESEQIHYSFLYQCLHCFNIVDEDIPDILLHRKDIVIYDTKMYEEIGNEKYLNNLKEYKDLKDYLMYDYDFDLDDEYIMKGRLVNDYIEISQINEPKALKMLNETIDDYFEIDDFERKIIINYVLKIKEKMPNWRNGGKITDNIIDVTKLKKVGRNDKCPCGSGKKYKNCCGKS